MVLSTPRSLLPTSAALLLGERSTEPLTAAAGCRALLFSSPPINPSLSCSPVLGWRQMAAELDAVFLFFFFSFGLRLENRKMKAGLEPLGAAWHGRSALPAAHRVCMFVPGERSESKALHGFILSPFFAPE